MWHYWRDDSNDDPFAEFDGRAPRRRSHVDDSDYPGSCAVPIPPFYPGFVVCRHTRLCLALTLHRCVFGQGHSQSLPWRASLWAGTWRVDSDIGTTILVDGYDEIEHRSTCELCLTAGMSLSRSPTGAPCADDVPSHLGRGPDVYPGRQSPSATRKVCRLCMPAINTLAFVWLGSFYVQAKGMSTGKGVWHAHTH